MSRWATADPLALAALLWPHVTLYDRQREIVRSVWEDDTTVVPAGHMLGKDFVAGFITLAFFLTRGPCRIVTTSVDQAQLEGVLWGEIRRFVQTSAVPLEAAQGGPLVCNHLHLRKLSGGKLCPISYCVGRVAAKGEGMSGHHVAKTGDGVPRTLFVADEASGVDAQTIEKAGEWADRTLLIGNPYDCENPFRWAVEGNPKTQQPGGDVPRPSGGYNRRVIRIRAEDSPNVKLALIQRARGEEPTGEMLLPGVLGWPDYQKRRREWDPVKQTVGLDAQFYRGMENLLFPPAWLDHSEQLARRLAESGVRRRVEAVGVDPGEGSADTSVAFIDRLGLIRLESRPTPDTSVIEDEVAALIEGGVVAADRVCMDRGGGGKQIADRLRRRGHDVRTVGFGDAATPDEPASRHARAARRDQRDDRREYPTRRVQMYADLRRLMDPSGESGGFAVPARYHELRRQLAPIPLRRDGEGRLRLPPKHRRPGSNEPSLSEVIGRSPDDADALVLAVHAMLHQRVRPVVSFG